MNIHRVLHSGIGLALILVALAAVARLGLAAAAEAPTKPETPRPAGNGVNLVRNGDFEKVDPATTLPAGWTTKHPANVRLIEATDGHGRVVEMTGDAGLMGTYGVDLTSDKIAFKPNTRYACTGYTKSKGPNFIVFVKGYATVTRQVDGQRKTFDDAVYQMRKEVHGSRQWQPFHLDFDVKPVNEFSDFQHRVQYLRITLWAYWPAGTGWYDDIRFEEVGPIPPSERLHPEAVTHTGLPPRLSKQAGEPKPAAFEEEDAWRDAANALRSGEHEQALRGARELIEHNPNKGDYQLLAARAAAKLERWDEAEKHVQWLLEAAPQGPQRQVEPWQQDWARVVRGEALLRKGRAAEARELLEAVVKSATSPHARSEAQRLLGELERGRK